MGKLNTLGHQIAVINQQVEAHPFKQFLEEGGDAQAAAKHPSHELSLLELPIVEAYWRIALQTEANFKLEEGGKDMGGQIWRRLNIFFTEVLRKTLAAYPIEATNREIHDRANAICRTEDTDLFIVLAESIPVGPMIQLALTEGIINKMGENPDLSRIERIIKGKHFQSTMSAIGFGNATAGTMLIEELKSHTDTSSGYERPVIDSTKLEIVEINEEETLAIAPASIRRAHESFANHCKMNPRTHKGCPMTGFKGPSGKVALVEFIGWLTDILFENYVTPMVNQKKRAAIKTAL